MIDPSIPRPLQDIVERELESDERVEWIEMPRRVFFTPVATAAFLFAIPWTAFALFWTAGAAGFKVPDFNRGVDLFPLFGMPFILIGLGMLSAPLWAYLRAGKTVYVITNRRAITFDGGWSKTTIRSYPPEDLKDTYRKEKQDGSGDVILARRAWRDSEGDRHAEELGFLRIADVKGVERRLKHLAQQGAHSERR